MTECGHERLVEGYYGHDCAACRELIYLYGSAPWDLPTDEEQARIDAEEYFYTHGTCETCGGEWGDGWSTCICGEGGEDGWLYRCGYVWARGVGCTKAGTEECDECPLRAEYERDEARAAAAAQRPRQRPQEPLYGTER